MPLSNKKYFAILIVCLWELLYPWRVNAETVKGPIMVNLDVPAGKWKAIRLKNLPKNAAVGLEVRSDGEIVVVLVDSGNYRRLPDYTRPLFMGRVQDKLSFSVSIPKSDNYYVVFDNRAGRQPRAVNMTVSAARSKTDSVDAANVILRQFEQQLHRIFIFNSFPLNAEKCDRRQAFSDESGITLCTDYVQQLYRQLGTKQKAQNALSFSIFHELAAILLAQWDHPQASQKAAADEFASVLMIMLRQREALSDVADDFSRNPSLSERMMESFPDDRHPLSVQRAQQILAWLKDPGFVRRWQAWLVPHMQTVLLKKLLQNPTEWTDLPLIKKELSSRTQKHTRKNLGDSVAKVG